MNFFSGTRAILGFTGGVSVPHTWLDTLRASPLKSSFVTTATIQPVTAT